MELTRPGLVLYDTYMNIFPRAVKVFSVLLIFAALLTVVGNGKIDAAITPVLVADITGQAASDMFSKSLSPIGDINGDGVEDFAIGAQNYPSGGVQGRVYIFFGGAVAGSLLAIDADVIITGEASSNFGESIAPAGDVNGDGFDDLIVGASYYTSGGIGYRGRAYIFYGSATFGTVGTIAASAADVIMEGEAAYNILGSLVSSAGDVNGDGFDDVIVGAKWYTAFSFAGRAYVFYGSANMGAANPINASSSNIVITSEAAGDNLGAEASGVGDVNGDGFDDLAVGSPRNGAGGVDTGRAYIIFGSTTLATQIPIAAASADVIITGEVAGDYFGIAGTDPIDVNSDGINDLVIGAVFSDLNGVHSGRVYIFYGSPSLTDRNASTADIVIYGESASDRLGNYVSALGDVNNDGRDDILISAYHYNGGTDQGRAYVFFSSSLDSLISPINVSTADVIITGASVGDCFGANGDGRVSQSYFYDINNDGWNEWGVGAFAYNVGANQGKAYIYNLNYASPVISMIPLVDGSSTSVSVVGTASETGVNVAGVEISLDSGTWTSCAADDGAFDSGSEAYTCTVTGLTLGDHTVRVRSYDENGVYSPPALYEGGSFNVRQELPQTGAPLFMLTLIGVFAVLLSWGVFIIRRKPNYRKFYSGSHSAGIESIHISDTNQPK
jgi:LPXTG-motif cell wall-anchored protein